MSITNLRIPSIEVQTVGNRDPSVPVDTIVIHTTDTAGLRRYSTDKTWNLQRVNAAASFGGISQATANVLRDYYNTGKPMSDGVAMCLIAASNDRRASWHYAVSSAPLPGTSIIEVVEFVPPEKQAHHIGDLNQPTNKRSIGIENLYPGGLPGTLSEADAWAKYKAMGWMERPYKAKAPDGAYYWFTPQHPLAYAALVELCRKLIKSPVMKSPVKIEGHNKYAPSIRIDPDPPISLERLRKDVFAPSFQRAGIPIGIALLSIGTGVGYYIWRKVRRK